MVFVDSTVDDYDSLLDGIGAHAQIVILDGARDGVRQMEAALEGRTNLSAIHLISHGSAGELQLGDRSLSADDLLGEYASSLATIGSALAPDGDFLVYACDFGQGSAGQAAVVTLAALTGADVAASNDRTGLAELGGDWLLEVRSGDVTTAAVVDARTQQDWNGVLADDLTIEVVTAPNFVVDSNLQAGPHAAYLSARFTNTGDTTLNDVFVYAGNYVDGINDTPGIYPTTITPGFGGDPLSGTFALTHEASLSDAARYVGTLAPGESVVHYWLVSYPWTDADGTPVFRANADDSDDLSLEYDIWAKAAGTSGAMTEVATATATLRNEISAMANKIWPNTSSKVPDEYLTAFENQLGWRPDQIAPGVARTEGVWYDLGRVNQGFDADANLIPDYDVWMQPVGDPSAFDPDAWMLVHTYGVLVVKLNDGTEQVIAFEDQLYHKDLPANNTGVVGLVFYEFAPIGTGAGALSPYQEAASGSNNEKFNGDYGTFVGGPEGGPPSATIDKTGPATVTANSVVTYTLTATNTSTTVFGLNEYGLPAVISEAIPVGTFYQANSADDNLPAIVDRILFSTDGGLTWTTVEPTASSVTNIQWWLDRPLDPLESVTVQFDLVIPPGYSQTQVYNTAALGLGGASELYFDSVLSLVTGAQTISGLVWSDNGPGGGTAGDAVRQGGETTAIPNITVVLYADLDGDGVLDADEQAVPRATTASAAGTGEWSFANLPNGKFIVQIRYDDPDRPTGYVLSTVDVFAVTLAGSDATGLEFGFAPTLDIDKFLVSPTPVLEGTTVTYGIEVTNLLKPDGYTPTTPYDGHVFFANATTNVNYVPPTPVPATGINTFLSSLPASPTEIAFDEDRGHVYLGYASTGLIERRNLDGTGAVTIATGQSSLSGLAVDAVQGYVYWTQSGSVDTISRRAADGAGAIDTVTGLNNPEGVAIDPFTKTVYWVETQGNLLRIRRSDLSFSAGSIADLFTPTTIGSGNHNPKDLEIDPLRGKLYWIDDKSGTGGDFIGVVNLDGTGLQQFITNGATLVNNPVGLGIDLKNGFLYWSDSGGLVKASTVGGPLAATRLLTGAGFNDVEVPTRFLHTGSYDFDKTLALIPLTDDYDPTELRFVSASIAPTSVDVVNGVLTWDNVGPVHAGATKTIYVRFEVLEPPSNATNASVDNTATVVGAEIANGLAANDDSDIVIVTVEPTATIGDTIWSNRVTVDGVQQAGEPGIPNVKVDLFNSAGTVLLQSTRTDANGNYRFQGVTGSAAGTQYIVRIDTATLPGGSVNNFDPDGGTANQSFVTITDPAGAAGPSNNLTQDFGYSIPNLFFGTIYEDIDADGALDSTEPRLQGITVRLFNSSGTQVASTTTGSDGSYYLSTAAAGSYRVVVDSAAFPVVEWTQTDDPDATLDHQTTTLVPVTTGEVKGAYEYGYHRQGTSAIGDQLFIDANGNGVFDSGEAGIAGVSVLLYRDANNDGLLQTNIDLAIATTVSGYFGAYLFDDLAAGNYLVVVDEADPQLPAGLVATTLNPQAVALAAATTRLDVDFGFEPTAIYEEPATIGDFIFYDANANGQQDENELGISGVTVVLRDVDGNIVATTTTSSGGVGDPPAGYYQFTNVNPDSKPSTPLVDGIGDPYVVEVVAIPAAAGTTLADLVADPNRDGVSTLDTSVLGLPPGDNRDTGVWRDLNANGVEEVGERGIFVASGVRYAGADFGYLPRGVVGDYIWLDLDNDGFQDASEVGLAGVAVSITNVPFGGSTTYNTTTTDDGAYFFQGLTSGTWRISVATPVGTTASARVDANLLIGTGGIGANTADVTIDAAGNVTQVVIGGTTLPFAGPHADDGAKLDFGYRLNGTHSLSGTVVLEQIGLVDGNSGEASDTAVAGVTVFLFDDANTLIGTTLTDDSGNYSFTNLPAGNYKIALVANDPVLENSSLTTDNFAPGSLPAGVTVIDNGASAILTVSGVGGDVSGLDFAWVSNVLYDFGDLPDSYGTTLTTDGARHVVSGPATLFLGAASPDAEGNGAPDSSALGDNNLGLDDEDGVTVLDPTLWGEGADPDNQIRVVVNGAGWLVAWIDFDNDGSFLDPGDMVISQSVTSGVHDIGVTVPTGALASGGAVLNARFRLFTSPPVIPLLAYAGAAVGGEVEDGIVVLGAPEADLSLTKTIEGGDASPPVGSNITFVIAVTNSGPNRATGVTVRDLLPTGLAYVSDDSSGAYNIGSGVWTINTLDSGDTVSLRITVLVLASGDYTNYAQILSAGTPDPDSNPGDNSTTEDDDDSVTVTPTTVSGITVVKTGPAEINEGGASATFTYTVTSQSSVTDPQTVAISDDNGTPGDTGDDFAPSYVSGDTDNDGRLDSSETWIYTATRTINLNAGVTHTNIVQVTGTDDEGDVAYDTDDHLLTVVDVAPSLTVDKSGPLSVNEGGASVTYTFTITNTSAVTDPLTVTAIDDDRFGSLLAVAETQHGGPITLAAGASFSFTYATTLTQDAGTTHTNLVTVTGTDDEGSVASDDDPHTVTFVDVAPSLTVDKSGPLSVNEGGASVTYTFTITNTSAVTDPLMVTSIDDDRFGSLLAVAETQHGGPITLAAGASFSFTYAATLTQDAGSTHTNLVTVTGTDDEGNAAADDDPHTVTFVDVAPSLTVDKSGPLSVNEGGASVTYTLTITNTSTVTDPLTVTAIDDDRFGSLLAVAETQHGGPITLAAGASFSFTYAATLTQDAGSTHTNLVTVTGTDDEGSVATDDDPHTLTFTDVAPSVAVVKSGPTTIFANGDTATYAYVVTSDSVSTDPLTVSLVDDNGTPSDPTDDFVPAYTSGDSNGDGLLDTDESWLFTATRSLTLSAGAVHTNIVLVAASDDEGGRAGAVDAHTLTAIRRSEPDVPPPTFIVVPIIPLTPLPELDPAGISIFYSIPNFPPRTLDPVEQSRPEVASTRQLGQFPLDVDTDRRFWPWLQELREQETPTIEHRFWPWLEELRETEAFDQRQFWPWLQELQELTAAVSNEVAPLPREAAITTQASPDGDRFWPWLQELSAQSQASPGGVPTSEVTAPPDATAPDRTTGRAESLSSPEAVERLFADADADSTWPEAEYALAVLAASSVLARSAIARSLRSDLAATAAHPRTSKN